MMPEALVVAVLVPCNNEEQTISSVVRSFRSALPGATIYVYDNNSADGTRAAAEAAGAEVRVEPTQGKGWVIRRMFADIDADYYVLVDGDDTYDSSAASSMLSLLEKQHLAMVIGRRLPDSPVAYRSGHELGNRVFTRAVAVLFGERLTDILSGYRVMSRGFVKSFPVFSSGFEIETELTVHALTLRLPVAEGATRYRARPHGSLSKLHKYPHGLLIPKTILALFKNEKPLLFFSLLSSTFVGVAL